MSATYYIGIDGGGTHCRGRLIDQENRILAEQTCGPANVTLGLEAAEQTVIGLCHQLVSAANIDISLKHCHVGIGLAGLVKADQEREKQQIAQHFHTAHIHHDAHIACIGAHGGRDGSILILGTGTCGYALRAQRGHMLSGWGFALSDHGSGAVAGLYAARRAMLAAEQIIAHTPFTREVLRQLGGDCEAMLNWSAHARPRDYGTLAPLVFDFADYSDPEAQLIRAELLNDVERLLHRLKQIADQPIALLGGLSTRYTPHLRATTRTYLTPPVGNALDGALYLAQHPFKIH